MFLQAVGQHWQRRWNLGRVFAAWHWQLQITAQRLEVTWRRVVNRLSARARLRLRFSTSDIALRRVKELQR